MKLPEDTENTKYLPWPEYEEISLYDLMGYAERYFPDTHPSEIMIDRMEIQVDCFGYDLYDKSDYRWYYVFSKVS